MFDIEIVEQATFMYLRSLSFNSVSEIFRSWFEKDVFPKRVLLSHIERLSEKLPSNSEITNWLQPIRSGYYALDGTWMKYRGNDFVLLILFDVETLDIVNYRIASAETEQAYLKLLKGVYDEINANPKGFFCDGDPGLLKALKTLFPQAPIQLCVFHKYCRAGQIISFKYIKNDVDKEIKKKVESILFAKTKQEAIDNLKELESYAQEHQKYEKLKKLIGVLKHNFELLLTHFDNPEMSPYNNTLEGFNYIVKRKTKLMKGFKKPVNIGRWIKLIMIDWRFHRLVESTFKERKNKSPLELSGCNLPKIYNWMSYIRRNYHIPST